MINKMINLRQGLYYSSARLGKHTASRLLSSSNRSSRSSHQFLNNHKKRQQQRKEHKLVSLKEASQQLAKFVEPKLDKVLCVPIKPRPAFPGWPIVLPVKDEATIAALREAYHSSNPYVALLLEDPPEQQESSSETASIGLHTENSSTSEDKSPIPKLVRYPPLPVGKSKGSRVPDVLDSPGDDEEDTTPKSGPRDRELEAEKLQSRSFNGSNRSTRPIRRSVTHNSNFRSQTIEKAGKGKRKRHGKHGRSFELKPSKDNSTHDEMPSTLYEIGTLAEILKLPEDINTPNTSELGRVFGAGIRKRSLTGFQVKGVARIHVEKVVDFDPPLKLKVTMLEDVIDEDATEEILVLRGLLREALKNAVQQRPDEWPIGLLDQCVGLSGGKLADLMFAHMEGNVDLQPALAESNVVHRMRMALQRMNLAGLIGGEGMKRRFKDL